MTSTTSVVPTAEPEPSLIKTDVLGRVQRTREQRKRILDEYQRSGLSGPKFAALCGVKYQTFPNWLQQRKRQPPTLIPNANRSVRMSPQVRWLEASVQSGAGSGITGLLLQLSTTRIRPLTKNSERKPATAETVMVPMQAAVI